MKLPERLLDEDGYPTQDWLDFIRAYKPDKSLPIMSFIQGMLIDGWWMPEWGFRLHRQYAGKRKLELHTGGWSGNEDVIAAINSNLWLTYGDMEFVSWRRGGHYYFEVKIAHPKTAPQQQQQEPKP